jgi:hypothetical protein
MKLSHRLIILLLIALMAFCLTSCAEKKEGKVIVTEQEFSIRQDAEYNWVIDAKGKIRNVGDVDVKKVVVTGYCRSCSEIWSAGMWLKSDSIEKSPEQQDIISYLTAGDEEAFSFKEVAFFFRPGGPGPEGVMPDNLEIVIESFETVE